jgi:hypothetical protein
LTADLRAQAGGLVSISFGNRRFTIVAAVLAAVVGFLLVVAFMRGD